MTCEPRHGQNAVIESARSRQDLYCSLTYAVGQEEAIAQKKKKKKKKTDMAVLRSRACALKMHSTESPKLLFFQNAVHVGKKNNRNWHCIKQIKYYLTLTTVLLTFLQNPRMRTQDRNSSSAIENKHQ